MFPFAGEQAGTEHLPLALTTPPLAAASLSKSWSLSLLQMAEHEQMDHSAVNSLVFDEAKVRGQAFSSFEDH